LFNTGVSIFEVYPIWYRVAGISVFSATTNIVHIIWMDVLEAWRYL